MSSSREPASFGIGEVLGRLRAEFPDVSTSKIRFLEAEGLIEPARSADRDTGSSRWPTSSGSATS